VASRGHRADTSPPDALPVRGGPGRAGAHDCRDPAGLRLSRFRHLPAHSVGGARHALPMDLTTVLVAVGLLLLGLAIGWRIGRTSPAPGATDASATVGALLGTAGSALERVESQLREIERDRVGAYTALQEQVAALHRTSAELSHQTRTLSGALRSPQVRGRWGEIQLERIVELAGMAEHCDFATQVSVSETPGGPAIARPDLVVRLSGGRQIPVDAKVPFAAWLEAMDRGEGPESERLLTAHARAVRAHVDVLAAKAYWRHFQPAPEFVIMFIPGEPLLDAALARDPGLADHAFSRNVVLATPTTLITLLRTVAFSWRQETLGAHAAQIHALGRELHVRLGTLGEHVERLGSSLGRAVEHYNGAVASLESRVLVTARKFTDLQSGPPLAEPTQVDHLPRRVQAPELLDGARPEDLLAAQDFDDAVRTAAVAPGFGSRDVRGRSAG
jgi:DNA recombination protein RmuC